MMHRCATQCARAYMCVRVRVCIYRYSVGWTCYHKCLLVRVYVCAYVYTQIQRWMDMLSYELAERIAEDEWEHHRRPRNISKQHTHTHTHTLSLLSCPDS